MSITDVILKAMAYTMAVTIIIIIAAGFLLATWMQVNDRKDDAH